MNRDTKGTPDIPDANAKQGQTIELEPEVALEREIRRYVKIGGGLRKGLSDEDILRAEELVEKAGRTVEDPWNMDIDVPGFRNVIAMPPKAQPDLLRDKTIIDQKAQIDKQQETIDKQGKMLEKMSAQLDKLTPKKRGRPSAVVSDTQSE